MKIVSLFSGCGGLDLGFENAGFEIVWANEFDRKIWRTYEYNFPRTKLDKRSIINVLSPKIPSASGIIGGPPCQSWSEAGALRGINDRRGKVFFEFIRILKDKQPLFFLAENVSGMLASRHKDAFQEILKQFDGAGYKTSWKLLNAKSYRVPQDRRRVIFVGYRKDLGRACEFPSPIPNSPTLKDSIWDLRRNAKPAQPTNKTNGQETAVPNHEYLVGNFSTIYMSRNRVRNWGERSYTIQAGGRHAPIHPQANKMIFVEQNKRIFDPKSPKPYRRLSVRECARIQTFPDRFKLIYDNVAEGYKMVGNAVPVNFAEELAKQIKKELQPYLTNGRQVFKRKKELDNVPYKVQQH